MEADLHIDVATLDAPQRRVLEEVIGRQLAENHRLLISVQEVQQSAREDSRPAQTLEDWTRVYDGLTEDEIEALDEVIKTRADLTRT